MKDLANPKRRPRLDNPLRAGPSVDAAGLRSLAVAEPKEFMARAAKLVDERKLTLGGTNLPHLYHALADVKVETHVTDVGRSRAIMASAFPLLVGGLMVAEINETFESVNDVGDQLVSDMDDSKKVTVVARLQGLDTNVDGVREAEEFPEIGAGEESYEIGHKRNGRLVKITKEMIEENDVAGIVQRINALSQIASDTLEKLTLDRVTDRYGSAAAPAAPYVLKPRGGSPTSLYSSTANTPGTRAPLGTRVTGNALTSTANLDNARTRLAAMKNDRGERFPVPMARTILLVPDALVATASKLLGSELEPGIENELNNWGPRGLWRPKLLSTPRLDDLSTTTWYYGDFAAQFKRKWKLRAEYVELGEQTETYLRSRIAFQARVAWDCEVGAVDYNRVVQCVA